VELDVFVTLGLGDNSFLVASGGEAALVDPQRDAWRFLAAAEARRLRVRYVLETHVHNDYVSGALEVRAATGAEIVAPARGGYAFAHRPADEGEELDVGGLRLVAWETPGHTFEHLAWAAFDGDGNADAPEGVFTGGSLLVGSAGRSDLLGMDLAEELSRAQYRSVQRLKVLPDRVRVLPTHGAGSFCVANLPQADRDSTIAVERRTNPALLAADEETFVREQLTGLMRYPTYYAHMASTNRSGPRVLGDLPALPPLSPADVAAGLTEGVWVVDARDRTAFAAAHIPGSLNIELNEAFGTYVGWVTPFGARLMLVLPEPVDEAARDAVAQLIRIGYDNLAGHLAGGIEAWEGDGNPATSYPIGTARDLRELLDRGAPFRLLDVRQPGEWESEGRVPGSLCRFVADLPGNTAALPRDEELWVICTNGHRAAIAASWLDREGFPVRLVARSGILGLAAYLEAGPEATLAPGGL
jgi:glyoxylase-like metal-dependent hydrolase (beta-lactamase superfamily II)/rhodanese-related sulfurtransferase